MDDAKKFQGRISFEYFELLDGSWEVKIVVHEESDLPDPSTNLRAYVKMGIMTAQLDSYAKEQLTALELILAGKEEMKLVKSKKADVDKYQLKLPFEPGEED